ncbi:unnamed protein product [Alopecurus aequalis]
MTREGKLQKKQPPEAEKYHIARREPYASRKNKSGGRRERECSPDGEWLPPPPPLDGNVKPTKYHGAIPSLPQPPRRSRSGCSKSATTVAPTSPKSVSPLRETDQVVHTSDAGAPLAKHDGGSENDDDHDVSGVDCSFIHDLLRDEAMAALDADYDLDSLYTTMQESTPDGVKKLVSLFQALAMRLEGKTPPSIFGDEIATLAEKEARPLLKKLDMAVTSATSEVQLLREEVPGLEEEMSKMKDLELEHEKKAEELEREAADARKLAKGLRNQQRTMANKLQCIKIASNTFDAQTKQLKQRADEVIDFLQLFETEEKKVEAEEPPEAALILAYACNFPDSA